MKRIFFIAIIFSSHIFAQQNLTLQNAVNIALKNNLDIQLSKNNVQANTILNNYGVAGGLPLITGTASDNEQSTNIDQKYSDASRDAKLSNVASNNLNAGITAGILLYNGMNVVATKHKLEELETQSKQYLNAEVENIIDSVMMGYYNIVLQQQYMKTFDQSIDAANQKLNIVKTQQSVGLANNADLFQSQLDLNALLQSKQSQQLIIDEAKTSFLNLLFLKPDSSLTIHDTIIVDTTIRLDDILNKLQNNPDILAADEQIKINQLIVKETAALRYPSLRLNTGYSLARTQTAGGFSLLNESYGPLVGLSLAVPIFNGTTYKREQRVAEINTQDAQLQKQILIQNLTASVIKLYEAYQNNSAQITTQKQSYLLSQQLLSLVLQRFNLRQATIIDVKTAEQTFEDAAFGLVNLSFAAKSAEIELKHLAYTLSF
jgi:outer membrane protein TolC